MELVEKPMTAKYGFVFRHAMLLKIGATCHENTIMRCEFGGDQRAV